MIKILMLASLSLVATGCAVGPKSQMDREFENGGRISKLFNSYSKEEVEADVLSRINAKCPQGHRITETGKKPTVFGTWQIEVDYIEFECTNTSKRETASK